MIDLWSARTVTILSYWSALISKAETSSIVEIKYGTFDSKELVESRVLYNELDILKYKLENSNKHLKQYVFIKTIYKL